MIALYAVYLGLLVISVLISLLVAFRFLKHPEAIKLESRKFLLPLVVCFGLTLASFFSLSGRRIYSPTTHELQRWRLCGSHDFDLQG
jgi:hypothetical protein